MTIDEKEVLEDLMTTPEYWDVITKAIVMGVERQKENVLTQSLDNGDRAIALAKARLEGAEQLARFVAGLKKRKKEK